MKHTVLLYLAVIIYSTILPAQNLITNGGFEENPALTDSIYLWERHGQGTLAAFSISTDDPAEGSHCAQIAVSQLGSNYWDIEMRNFTVSAEEGVAYKISLKAKASVAGRHLNFIVTKATTPFTYYADNRDISLTTDWVNYTYMFVCPVTSSNDISVAIHFTEISTYWIDDVVVEKSAALSSQVNTNGTTMRVIFAQEMQDPALEPQITFFAHVAPDEIIPVTDVAIDANNPEAYNLTLADTIYHDQDVQLEYIPGTVVTVTGLEISAFLIDASNYSRQELISDIEQTNDIGYLLYPNPAEDYIILDGNSSSGIKFISVLDFTGKTLFFENYNGESSVQISINSLRPGMYILKAVSLDEKSTYYKFIKK